jgi:hypothetical protein
MERLILEVDGCYIDSTGMQHFTFPREATELEGNELALAEYYWHINPQWQGQWEEGVDEVKPNYEELFDTVDAQGTLGVTKVLFPRQTFIEDLGDDHDALAYCEWQWYLKQR